MASLSGSFLVARPVLADPNFRQSVVLILGHAESGAYGVVVNRPVSGADLPLALFHGGPCASPGPIMLHGHSDWVEEPPAEGPSAGTREVAPGVYVGDAACLKRAAEPPEGETYRYRVFQGYAGWGPGQLEGEIAAGAWAVVPANGELLFDVPPDELWVVLRPRGIPEPSVN